MAKVPGMKARPRAAQIFAVIIAGIIAVSTVLTFGIIFVLVNVLGLLTPPVGPVLNVACAAGRVRMDAVAPLELDVAG